MLEEMSAEGLAGAERALKRCTQCNELLPLEQFYRTVRARGGYCAKCKQCTERARANSTRYRQINRELNLSHAAKYREANRDKCHAATKKWRDANRDAYNATRRRYRAANAEKFRLQNAQLKQWKTKYVTGNWENYFAELIWTNRHRKSLTVDQLLCRLNEQEYKCALTGRLLTCIYGRGKVPTNASLDRISAGGSYTIDNIQLVCRAVNEFRGNLPIPEYIDWCRSVVEYHDQNSTSTIGSPSSASALALG